MGGSKSTPKQQNAPVSAKAKVAPSVDTMAPYMAMLQSQQAIQARQDAAAAELQQQAQINAQNEQARQAGMVAMQQGEAAARSALGGMNVGQQMQDQASMAAQQKAGAMATGTDVGQMRQASLGGMAAGQQGAAAMAANAGAGGGQQRSNMFSIPTTTGLTFGGA
jgi:hypothetical protein